MIKTSTTAERLRVALEVNGVSAAMLSTYTGISRSSISQYLSGKNQIPPERLELICKELNVSPAWLMGYNSPMRPAPEKKKLQTLTLRKNLFYDTESTAIHDKEGFGDSMLPAGTVLEPIDFLIFEGRAEFLCEPLDKSAEFLRWIPSDYFEDT